MIRWGMVEIELEGRKEDALVVKYIDEPFVCYWVKLGGLIDATVREHYGPYIVGIGAKKYKYEIEEAIRIFNNGYLSERNEPFKLIKGGRTN
jgi:hypothetical protein